MNDKVPFLLREATIALYPAAADGTSVTGGELWLGALAVDLTLEADYRTVRIMGSGERYATSRAVDEAHRIEIGRTWMIRRMAAGDFVPERKGQYVLSIVWVEDLEKGHSAAWYRRDYLGVTGRSLRWVSRGVNQFGSGQVFEAQRFTEDQGFVTGAVGGGAPTWTQYPGKWPDTGGTPPAPVASGPPVYSPLPPSGDMVIVPFFRENIFVVGEYFLGRYRWDRAVKLVGATLMGWPDQVTATVVELEVNGVLTGQQLVLPVGPANADAAVSLDLTGTTIGTGSTVRWKIVGGSDDPAVAGWTGSISMGVR